MKNIWQNKQYIQSFSQKTSKDLKDMPMVCKCEGWIGLIQAGTK